MSTEVQANEAIEAAVGVVPHWAAFSRSTFTVKKLSGGTTNTVWLVERTPAAAAAVSSDVFEKRAVVRVFGVDTDRIIDRTMEERVSMLMGSVGRVPRIFGKWPGGVVTSFAPGRTLKSTELSSFIEPIATEMALWHKTDCSREFGTPTIGVWPLMHEWINACERASGLADLVSIDREAQWLEQRLTFSPRGGVPIACLCHNDVQSLNIIVDSSSSHVTFIDLEYSMPNSPLFDIANHFCEYGGLECDFSRFPSESIQRDFLVHYLRALTGVQDPDPSEVEVQRSRVLMFTLVSHLLWGVWGVFRARRQQPRSAGGFDYVRYAIRRLEAYDSFKRELKLDGGYSGSLASILEQ